ncbi:MAG: hypothetical protein PHV11_04455 [Candidatus Bipolaricaulis sp.]|nr:hypothetical protein [Candidatus Bipolaricaulis sp.]
MMLRSGDVSWMLCGDVSWMAVADVDQAGFGTSNWTPADTVPCSEYGDVSWSSIA